MGRLLGGHVPPIGQAGGLNYFNGLIDEIKIFNYALTAEQVKMEYAGGGVRFED